MEVSVYKTHFQVEHGWILNIEEILMRIRDKTYNRYIDIIDKLRLLPTEEEESKYKEQLPLICFSGTFTKRTDKDCIKHSGLICLDFDDESFDTIMQKPEYIYAAFKSPTGTGVKVLVRIPAIIEDHTDYYWSLADYFGLDTIDEKCRNISRGCYLSYDENMYHNPEAPIFYKLLPKTEVKREKSAVNNPYFVNSNDKIVERLLKQHYNEFYKGNRNNACYIFACDLNRFGVPDTVAIETILQFQEEGFSFNEIKRTVKSAYQTNVHEFKTKAFKDSTIVNKAKDYLKKKVSADEVSNILQKQDGLTPEQAAKALEEAERNIQNEFFWKLSSNGQYVIIDHDMLNNWYHLNNIKRFKITDNDWTMIKDDNCHIKEINTAKIKDYIRVYLESNKEHCNAWTKSEVMKRLNKQYLKDEMYEWLEPVDIDFLRDKKDIAYFFYKNTWIKITAKDGIEKIMKNEDAGGSIWHDQVIDRSIEIIKDQDSIIDGEFAQFIWNITTGYTGTGNLTQKELDEAVDKFHGMCRTIGYILHNYKDPANPRAVILTDEVISDNPEGGVGKGVFIKGLSKIKNMVTMDGKSFNPTKGFLWQRVTLATQILALEDVSKLFNFEKLFSLITEGIEVEKKNKDSFYIPYSTSPKILITSNYVIQGSGASHDRRRIEIELKQYYKPDFTPRDKFGHNLYDDWSDAEWNLFDNFMMYCVHQYLVHGIAKPKNKNLSFKKLKNSVPDMFIEWMDLRAVELDQWHELAQLCDDYRLADQDCKKVTNRKISGWIKEYADYNKFDYVTKVYNSGTMYKLTKR